MSDKQITRNAEEQEAFEQLVHALSFMREMFKGDTFMEVVQGVERELLARGFQIVKIPSINPVVMIPKLPVHRIDGAGMAYCQTTPTPLTQFLTDDDDKITCVTCISQMEHDAHN